MATDPEKAAKLENWNDGDYAAAKTKLDNTAGTKEIMESFGSKGRRFSEIASPQAQPTLQILGSIFNKAANSDEFIAKTAEVSVDTIKNLRQTFNDVASPVELSTNCYSFAMGDMDNVPGDKQNPGAAAGFSENIPDEEMTTEEIIKRAQADGAKHVGYDLPAEKDRTPGTYLVALYVHEGEDYHWVKQNPVTHEMEQKMGHQPAEPMHNKAVDKIPEYISDGIDPHAYQRVAFFEVPNEGINVGMDAREEHMKKERLALQDNKRSDPASPPPSVQKMSPS